jgi:hypothetical protein
MRGGNRLNLVGETLEQHCEIEFEKVRAMAFPRAYFEKDNDAKSGSKGDYIFKDFSEEGIEFLSIMFEMKNEGDETATKKKNDDAETADPDTTDAVASATAADRVLVYYIIVINYSCRMNFHNMLERILSYEVADYSRQAILEFLDTNRHRCLAFNLHILRTRCPFLI